MKTEEIEAWTNDYFIKQLKEKNINIPNINFNSNTNYKHKIKIIIETAGRTAKITESDFDELLSYANEYPYESGVKNKFMVLKKKLFGGENE